MVEHGPTTSPPMRHGQSVYFMLLLATSYAVICLVVTFPSVGSSGNSLDDVDLSFSPLASNETKSIPATASEQPRQSAPSDRFPTLVADNNATNRFKTVSGGGGSTSSKSGGMHVCTCLTADDPRNANLPPKPKRLRWLHIPKTGTSFISTLWSYAASNSDRYIDLDVSSFVCGMYDNIAYSMYDFALMKRYPWEIYGARNMIPPGRPMDKDVPLGLVGGTQHTPLAPNLKDRHYATSRHYERIKHERRVRKSGSEIFHHNITVATFFRESKDRLVSAYFDGRHASGFDQSTAWKELLNATVKRTRDFKCNIDGNVYYNPLVCFARYPGIAGCMSRMLTGETCADGILREAGLENLQYAFDVVMNHLDFVGLTEDWNESICQFHRLFMGKFDEPGGKRVWDPPLQGEFSNVHKSNKRRSQDVKHLDGFKDLADSVLYEAAKLKFEKIVGGDRCYEYMTFDELKHGKSTDHGLDVPFFKRDDEGNVCQPMSCSDLGKQCGEWSDGCGRTVICGMCNVGRTALPSTWRVQCVRGQCVDYCPTWDEKGFWFKSDNAPSIVTKTIREQTEDQRKHLSPVDAVGICNVACAIEGNNVTRPDGIESFINTGLCKCGKTPSILKANLTLQDFSLAHDLNALCGKTKAGNESVLLESDTQPVCCPYMPLKPTALPEGWKRLYSMGGSNLEGEYFEHVQMGCGGYAECKSAARQKQAEMAVFDLFNSMCYLARNVVDLKDSFTVTKDNQYRFFIDLRIEGSTKLAKNYSSL